jgi:CTD small phosphatase-like protein 2
LNPPYLPAIKDGKKYTLVLDLDETLIHYVEESQGNCTCNIQSHEDPSNCNCGNIDGQFLVRPGAHNFLKEMSEFFEIVIFTAAV